jgi:Acetyltransferase (GNAT) domain
MAAICTLTAPQDLFAVCNRGPWVEKSTRLRFVFAGSVLYTVNFRAVLLDAPFTHVRGEDCTLPPPPAEFPHGVEVARIHSCPIAPTERAITVLPGVIRYVSAQYRHFYIDLTGSFADYVQKFSSKSRSTLKRKVRRFFESAGTSQALREFSRPEEMGEFHRLALALSRKTYQHRMLDAGIPDEPEFGRTLEALARRDQVRGFILLSGDKPVSYALCVATDTTLTLDKTGFDPDFSHCHPGTVLTYLAIERLFGDRFRTYDFGSGDFGYKQFYSTGNIWCADILYLERTLRNRVVVYTHHGLNCFSEGLKSFLDRLGLKARIKKLLHHGL